MNSNVDMIRREAEEVAWNYMDTPKHWSTWHSWHYWYHSQRFGNLRGQDRGQDSRELMQVLRGTKSSGSHVNHSVTDPYVNCVDFCTAIARQLYVRLASIPTLSNSQYSIGLLARPNAPGSDRLFHCIVAVRMPRDCVVIDINHPHLVEVVPHSDLRRKTTSNLTYQVHENADRESSLYWWGETEVWEFKELSETDALRFITAAMVLDTCTVNGRSFPRSKSIKLTMQFPTEPRFVTASLRNGKYVALACRIKIDFKNARVTVYAPYHDWLAKEEMGDMRNQILEKMGEWKDGLGGHIARDNSVIEVVIDLLPVPGRESLLKWLTVLLVGEMVELANSSMTRDDFEKVVRSVIKVWEYPALSAPYTR